MVRCVYFILGVLMCSFSYATSLVFYIDCPVRNDADEEEDDDECEVDSRQAVPGGRLQHLAQLCLPPAVLPDPPGILLGGPLALAPIHEDRCDTVLFVLLLEQAQGCLQDDLHEGDDEVEDEPDVDELHVGRPGQRVGDTDEEGCQHQKRGDIHSCYGFKVAFLKIGGV